MLDPQNVPFTYFPLSLSIFKTNPSVTPPKVFWATVFPVNGKSELFVPPPINRCAESSNRHEYPASSPEPPKKEAHLILLMSGDNENTNASVLPFNEVWKAPVLTGKSLEWEQVETKILPLLSVVMSPL